MAGVLANGLYLNTESGLTPMIDRLTGMLDKDSTARQQYAGIAPALAATGIPVAQPQGMIGGILSSLGIGGQPAAPQQASLSPAPTPDPSPQGSGGGALPAFAAGGGGLSPNAQQALAYFQDKGLSPIAAQGLVGGFMRESGGNLDPGAVNPNGGATGIAQWLGSRAQGLQQFAGAAGRSANDLKTQLDYAWSELSGPEKATLAALQKASNPLQATAAALGFERPEGWSASNPFGAKDFGKRLAATVGLGKMPADAMAFAGQAGSGGTPGTTDAGADVAAAGLAARTAAGYGAPSGVSTGAQTADATGAAPMPIASSGPSAIPTMQTGRAPGAAPAPALGAAAGVARAPLGGITNDALGAMIANPASRDLGLKLWQQKLGKGDFGFSVTPDGSVIRTDKDTGAAVLVYQAPVKQGFQELNGRLLATDPLSGSARDATPAGLPQGYRPATAQERAAYGVQPGAPLFFGPDNKPATLNSGTNVTVNNATNPILSGLGKQFVDGRAEADSAAKSLPMIQTAKTQLQNGIIAGAGANQVLALQKLGVALGLPGTDASKIVNTETFSASVKPLVMQLVKNLGSGNGITDADVRFVNEAVGGEKTLEPQSLARILDITERAARTKVTDYNSLADEMLKTPGGEAYKLIAPMMHVSMPPAAAAAASPAGGSTKTIGNTTYTKGADGKWYVGP